MTDEELEFYGENPYPPICIECAAEIVIKMNAPYCQGCREHQLETGYGTRDPLW